LRIELREIQPDHTLLEHEPEIVSLLDQVPLYDQLKQEKSQYEAKLSAFEEDLSNTREKLHLSINDDEMFAINTNIYMKNQVEIVSRKKQKLDEIKEELEDCYQEEKGILAELEKEERVAERQILSIQQRLSLEEKLSTGNSKQVLEGELRSVQDKIEFYQQANERDRVADLRKDKEKRVQFFLIEFILAVVSLYGMLTKQWFLFSIGLLGCIAAAIFMMKTTKKQLKESQSIRTLEALRVQEKQIKQKLHSAEYIHITELEEQLKLDNQRRDKLKTIQIKLKQQQAQYEKVLAKFETLELETAQNKEKLLEMSQQLKIPAYIADSFLLEAFELIEQYKSIFREKKQYTARLEQIKQQQDNIVNGLNHYVNLYLTNKCGDLYNAAYLLRTKLKEEHAKQIMYQERMSKLTDLEADLRQKNQELHHLNVEYQKLISLARVDTEQQFYELGAKAEKQGNLNDRLASLQRQLQYSILSEQERDSFIQIHQSDELLTEYKQEVHLLQARLNQNQEDLASIKYDIQVLEEGGVYSEILHHFKQKKFELEDTAKEWAIYCLAQDILTETIEKYKSIHLPRMISKAEEYLSFLTNGSYQRIHLQKSGPGFLVERKDHTIFEANELSQATTEQLYVAIRLALAVTVYEQYQFPIIIDDSFVNFDAKRTEKVIELLKGMEHNQLLFFTCHKHLLTFFPRENVLFLEKGAVQIIS
jgi:uncharacterized protein YhaN